MHWNRIGLAPSLHKLVGQDVKGLGTKRATTQSFQSHQEGPRHENDAQQLPRRLKTKPEMFPSLVRSVFFSHVFRNNSARLAFPNDYTWSEIASNPGPAVNTPQASSIKHNLARDQLFSCRCYQMMISDQQPMAMESVLPNLSPSFF